MEENKENKIHQVEYLHEKNKQNFRKRNNIFEITSKFHL